MPASSGRTAAACSKEARHDRRDASGSGHGQPLDDGRGQDRRVVLAGHGAVAPRAANGDAIRGVALLGDLDGVEPAPGDGRGHAAALVEGAGRTQPFRPVLGDPFRAGGPARLLVCGTGEQDVAAETRDRVAGRVEPGGTGLGGQEPDDPDLHRDHRLHVDGAAAVDVAALDVGGERMVRPAFGRGRDDVEVRQQQERLAAAAVSAQSRVDGAATGFGFDDLRFEPDLDEKSGDPARHAELAVGCVGRRRVDRRDPDQIAEVIDERADGERPGGSLDRARRGGRSRHRGALPAAMVRAMPMMKPPNISAATIATRSLP